MLHHTIVSVEESLQLSSKFKRNVYTALGLGIVLFVVGVILAKLGIGSHEIHETVEHVVSEHGTEGHELAEHGPNWLTRVYANLWLNSVFFTGISVMGLFFVCVQYVAWAGWSSLIKRVPEAFGSFLPFAAVSVILVFALGHHDLFHWTHHGLYDIKSPEYDKIIAGKSGYLNLPFYWMRLILYFGLWYLLWTLIRKQSLQEDIHGTDKYYYKSIVLSAIFIIIFAVTSATAAWDWIMSIDTHWFSTMFGWYVFASWWVTTLSVIAVTVIILKENGYLQAVNENHIHDLGKFIFAFSIFFTYIWFGQFLLIFYANLPEETIYYIERLHGYNNHYTWLFYFNLIVNFFFPFLALMTRDGKRKVVILKVVAIGVIAGHWLDFYMMIMPGTTKGTSGFGLMEIGGLLTYASLFILVISNTLTKSKLIPVNHPLLKESLYHNI